MRKKTKIWLVIATALIVVGCVIFGGVMTMLQWDFTKLSTVKYETNDYEIDENYKNISIVTDTADIVFMPSQNSKSSIVCHEQKNVKHSVTVKDDTLVIAVVDTRKWYEYIGINIGTPKITVYLPNAEYEKLFIKESTGNVEIPNNFRFESMDISTSTGDVKNDASASESIKIKTGTGNIRVENISAEALDLSVSTGGITVSDVTCQGDVKIHVSTGKTKLTDIACKNLTSSGNTGDISLKNVIAREKFSLERSTGDVKFDGCDAAEISVKTDTGDVTGTLLSEKVFLAETDTGRVEVPKTATGGRCEITTDTGDIRIKIQK